MMSVLKWFLITQNLHFNYNDIIYVFTINTKNSELELHVRQHTNTDYFDLHRIGLLSLKIYFISTVRAIRIYKVNYIMYPTLEEKSM